MIRLRVLLPNLPPQAFEWGRPVLSMGRAASNSLVVAADNVSSHHAKICLVDGKYVFQDNDSTNGSVLMRDDQKYLLQGQYSEMEVEVGDKLCLASVQNVIEVESIDEVEEEPEDKFERTILAEQTHESTDVETSLGDDFEALRCTVKLARELAVADSSHEIARLTAGTCLQAFPTARRALFLVRKDGAFALEHVESNKTETSKVESALMKSRQLMDRCMGERKGFLYMIEQNKMQAIATMISPIESLDSMDVEEDQIILCCPLFHQERCYGFIEVDAPITPTERTSLTRRDLSLATLMGHLVAARLYDLENQNARLKLARKATAGFLSAMVGHCFKNLLFVPMSISRMLPMCLEQGKMDEVEWMLARNGVNIRYLDILSNEFAAASKDPSQGFTDFDAGQLLREVAELINQISPDKVEAKLMVPEDLPSVNAQGGALKRLLMNLTLNAVDAFFGNSKHLEEKGKGVIELKAAVDPASDELCLVVRDNGPGIPEAILDNLREIARQIQGSADALSELQNIAEQVRSTKDQGFKEHYGLGFLFVCQTVTQHGGRLEIESTEGEGARFMITIPRRRAGQRNTTERVMDTNG